VHEGQTVFSGSGGDGTRAVAGAAEPDFRPKCAFDAAETVRKVYYIIIYYNKTKPARRDILRRNSLIDVVPKGRGKKRRLIL